MDYQVYLLDSSRNRIAQVRTLVKDDSQGNILTVIRRLSNYGSCNFRIAKDDDIFKKLGYVVQPWQYGVEVTRSVSGQPGAVTIFKGIIVNNPRRTYNYIDVQAYDYLYRLQKKLIKRDPETNPGDGKDNYRTFSSGTMAAAITAMIAEAKLACPSTDIIQQINTGQIDNPNFPGYFIKADGTPLTGAWTFSSDLTLQFDYKSLLYVLTAFGIYSVSDFQIDNNLNLNFSANIGRDQRNLVFEFDAKGSVFQYNAPLNGERTTNSLWSIAADLEGNVLHINSVDEASINNTGTLLEDVMGFLDVKDNNSLRSRGNQELQIVKVPDSIINIWIDGKKSYPFGQYDVGDTVTIKINDGPIKVNQARRITGINLTVHNTGREVITMETNPPKA